MVKLDKEAWLGLSKIAGIALSFGLAFWGRHLMTPIYGKEFASLASEVVNDVGTSFANVLREISSQPYVESPPSFDLALNLMIPGLMYLSSVVILAFIGYFQIKSSDWSNKAEVILQVAFLGLIVGMGGLFLVTGGKLVLFSIALAIMGFAVFALILGAFMMFFGVIFSGKQHEFR